MQRSLMQLEGMDAVLRARGFVHLIYLSPFRAHLERREAPDPLVEAVLAQTHLQVTRLRDHPELMRQADIAALYQDVVHLSARGHEVWASIIRRDVERATIGE